MLDLDPDNVSYRFRAAEKVAPHDPERQVRIVWASVLAGVTVEDLERRVKARVAV